MSSDSLIQALPDLVVGIRKDGVVLAVSGGLAVGELKPPADSIGSNVDAVWPEPLAGLVRQLTRKAITSRTTIESKFHQDGRSYELRATAQAPDRAVCVIRAASAGSHLDAADATGDRLGPQIDRRGFLKRCKESISTAVLREKPLAIAILLLDGVADIAQAFTPKLSEQILTTAILRLASVSQVTNIGGAAWYLGQLDDTSLALVVESGAHESIEDCVTRVCANIRQPVNVAGDVFQLTACAGVAILGRDSATPRGLLDNARAAANEARRGGVERICFFTDTLRLKTLARLDIARELREAIENREIQLRYTGRYDLSSGRLVAWVGYLRWIHPLRGEIRPLEFVRFAETTGLGTTLSRAALQWLREDYANLHTQWDPDVRISFGALRHHLSHEEFAEDIERFVNSGAIPAQRLELRISERNLGVRRPADFKTLAAAGVQLVIDEVGRGVAPWDWLARAPIYGMQLDRALVVAARKDPAALRVCRAVIGTARALGLIAIAPGIDNKRRLSTLAALRCQQGSGDYFNITATEQPLAVAPV